MGENLYYTKAFRRFIRQIVHVAGSVGAGTLESKAASHRERFSPAEGDGRMAMWSVFDQRLGRSL
ncbi:hypothetical protein B5P43_10145 [Bacillus sp. SRB_336]|nr:hypothetical protein B5P43_10145 [Bacillus sp. SRB_336]